MSFWIFALPRDLQFISHPFAPPPEQGTAKRKLCHLLQLSLLSRFHRLYRLPSETPRHLPSFVRVLILGAANVELGSYYQLHYHDIRRQYLLLPRIIETFETPSPVSIDVTSQYAPTTKRFWEELFRAVSLRTIQHKNTRKRPNLLWPSSLSPPLAIRDCGITPSSSLVSQSFDPYG